jgi:hypothetical protein
MPPDDAERRTDSRLRRRGSARHLLSAGTALALYRRAAASRSDSGGRVGGRWHRAGCGFRTPGPLVPLHGSVVRPASGGETVTAEFRNDKPGSVSRSSITLKSENGCTRTYAVTDSTAIDAWRNGIGPGNRGPGVVTATASGGTVTAIRGRDPSRPGAGMGNLPGQSGRAAVPAVRGGAAASSPADRPVAEPR